MRRDTPGSILDALRAAGLDRVMVTFEVKVPEGASPVGLVELLASQGYTRVHRERPDRIEVIQDRFRLGDGEGARAGGSTHFDGRLAPVTAPAPANMLAVAGRFSTGCACTPPRRGHRTAAGRESG